MVGKPFLFTIGGGSIVLAATIALWDKQDVTAEIMRAEHRVARAQFDNEFAQVMRLPDADDYKRTELETARKELANAREAAKLKTADANVRLQSLPGGEGAGGPVPATAEEAIASFK